MTYDEERVVTRSEERVTAPPPPVAPAGASGYGTTVTQEHITRRPTGPLVAQRFVWFVIGLILLVIALRVVLLLLNAREGNDLVSLIYNLSDPFVAPFRGILGQEAISSRGTYLDGAAIVAMVGWLIIGGVVMALLRVFRREA